LVEGALAPRRKEEVVVGRWEARRAARRRRMGNTLPLIIVAYDRITSTRRVMGPILSDRFPQWTKSELPFVGAEVRRERRDSLTNVPIRSQSLIEDSSSVELRNS